MAEFVKTEIHDGVGLIILDRPKMNALNRAMQDEIAQVSRDAVKQGVRVIVIFGGANFAAGADVKEMAEWTHDDAIEQTPGLQDAFTAVAKLPVPTIAALTGYALGGGLELALACDLRIAGSSTVVGQPEILLGVIPGAGGTQRLSRLVGVSRAKDLIYTGRFVKADEALSMGLVNEVVEDAHVLERAMELAAALAKGPRRALAAAKEAIDLGSEKPLDQGLLIERANFASLFGTPDQVHGMASFVEQGPGKAKFE